MCCSSLQLQSFVQQLLETEKSQRQRFSGLLARNTAASTAATAAATRASATTASATDADGTLHIGKMITRYTSCYAQTLSKVYLHQAI
jgi:hypothetical protein